MVIVTNVTLFILCVLFNKKLKSLGSVYGRQMGLFMLMMGVGSLFGAVAHAVHFQAGDLFFKTVLFLTNAFSLLSIYFFFRAAYTFVNPFNAPSAKYINLVVVWIGILLVISLVKGNFLLVKIHAGIVLLYSLGAHLFSFIKTKEAGAKAVVIGIFIAFLSIIAHSLRLSFHEWFNYKDIAHVIMIISLVTIYLGAKVNSLRLNAKQAIKI